MNNNKRYTTNTQHKYYNNAFFAKWARLYDFEKYLFPWIRKKAVDYISLKPKSKVLDVATGTGSQAFAFAKAGHNVIGIDLSPEMLQQAKKKCSDKLKLSFKQMDATKLNYKNDSFDASSISFGLHDMPYEIGVEVLKEIIRVTKKNGKMLIVDYNEPRKHWAAKLAYPIILAYETKNWKPFIVRGLNKLLKDVNLKAEKETNILGLVQLVVINNDKSGK